MFKKNYFLNIKYSKVFKSNFYLGKLVIFSKVLFFSIIPIILTLIFMVFFKEKINITSNFQTNSIGADVNKYLNNKEKEFNNIKEGVKKRIIWFKEDN